jgi:RHS repeat-associated protein
VGWRRHRQRLLTTGAAACGWRLLGKGFGLVGQGQIEHLFSKDFADFQEEVFDVGKLGPPRRTGRAVELIDKIFGNTFDVGPYFFHQGGAFLGLSHPWILSISCVKEGERTSHRQCRTSRLQLQTVSCAHNATLGSGTVVNDVQLQYNSFAQLIADYQSHSGAVNFGTSPVVQYGYANGSANTIRPTTMTYPNGRILNDNYGSTGGLNDALSRIGTLIDNDGVTQLANYSYLGLTNIIQVTEPQPGLTYTLIGITGGNDPVTGDIYRGLDLFGRIKDLIWTSREGSSSSSSSSSGASNVVERIQHGYDRADNRLWRKELADPSEAHDELYFYDGLYRLKDMQRGTLSSNQTVIAPLTLAQCWGLDSTGNWQNFQENDTGSGSWSLVQGRTANPVNEITAINNSVGAGWVTPAYDKAGHMTTMPQPASPGSSYVATYDAWNRLMTLSAGGSQVAGYQYDGLKRRTEKNLYSGGVLSSTRHYFYSSAWQVIEERLGTTTTPDRQFVWGLRYIDDIVLRDRDPNGIGILTERLFVLQDPNWNVTAIAGTSGIVQERYGYAAYGVPTVLTPAFASRLASLWDWETRCGGCRLDKESGLYQMRHRSYHPSLGTFVSRDPLLTIINNINLYRNAENNPCSLTDPTGLASIAAQQLAWGYLDGLASRLALFFATNPILASLGLATSAIALCLVTNALPDFIDAWLLHTFVGTDKLAHCIIACEMSKCLGSIATAIIANIVKEFLWDYLVHELLLQSGKLDPEDITANYIRIGCGSGAINIIPLTGLIGGIF